MSERCQTKAVIRGKEVRCAEIDGHATAHVFYPGEPGEPAAEPQPEVPSTAITWSDEIGPAQDEKSSGLQVLREVMRGIPAAAPQPCTACGSRKHETGSAACNLAAPAPAAPLDIVEQARLYGDGFILPETRGEYEEDLVDFGEQVTAVMRTELARLTSELQEARAALHTLAIKFEQSQKLYRIAAEAELARLTTHIAAQNEVLSALCTKAGVDFTDVEAAKKALDGLTAAPQPVKANHDAAPVRCAEEDPESQQCRDGMAPDGTGGTEPAAPAPAALLCPKCRQAVDMVARLGREMERADQLEAELTDAYAHVDQLRADQRELSAELEQVRKRPTSCLICGQEKMGTPCMVHLPTGVFVCNGCMDKIAELEQVKAERDLANRHAADLFKRLQAAEAALGEKGK